MALRLKSLISNDKTDGLKLSLKSFENDSEKNCVDNCDNSGRYHQLETVNRGLNETVKSFETLSGNEANDKIASILNAYAVDFAQFNSLSQDEKADFIPPSLALKAPAGVGKTVHILDMARDLMDKFPTLKILYLVPYLSLGEELHEKAQGLGLPSRVFRGRSQDMAGQADVPECERFKMCSRWKEAEKISSLSLDVKSHLCKRVPSAKNPEGSECPHFAECPYIQQLKEFSGLTIASHQYLTLKAEWISEEKIDLVIIDESFWQTFIRKNADIALDDFNRKRDRFPHYDEINYPSKDMTEDQRFQLYIDDCDFFRTYNYRLAEKILFIPAMQNRNFYLASDFIENGITAEIADAMYKIEYKRLVKPAIVPGMDDAEINEKLENAIESDVFSFARFWKNLSLELKIREGRLHSVGFNTKDKTYYVELNSHKDLKIKNIPVILIDADLDENITKRLFPVFNDLPDDAIQTLQVHNSDFVKITQVVDKAITKSTFVSFSQKSLARQEKSQNSRNLLFKAGQAIAFGTGLPLSNPTTWNSVQNRQKPLMIVNKEISDFWHGTDFYSKKKMEQELTGFNSEWSNFFNLYRTEEGLAFKNPDAVPFKVAHYGSIRGKDEWKDANSIIVVGRNEPTVDAIERMACALFYDDAENIQFIEAEEGKQSKYFPKIKKSIVHRNGNTTEVDYSCHIDARCQMVLMQIREAELTQAVARGRPIHRNRPLEIIVATNIPVEGMVVDRIINYDDLYQSRDLFTLKQGMNPFNANDAVRLFKGVYNTVDAFKKVQKRKEKNFDFPMFLAGIYQKEHLYNVVYRTEDMTDRMNDRVGQVFVLGGRIQDTVEQTFKKLFKKVDFEILDIKKSYDDVNASELVETKEEPVVEVEEVTPAPVRVSKFTFEKTTAELLKLMKLRPEPVVVENDNEEVDNRLYDEMDIENEEEDFVFEGQDVIRVIPYDDKVRLANKPVFPFGKYRAYEPSSMKWKMTRTKKARMDSDLSVFMRENDVTLDDIQMIWSNFYHTQLAELIKIKDLVA